VIKIELDEDFKKAYSKRIARNVKLVKKTKERITLFVENQKHPLLKDHALVGKKQGLRAFSITGDVRLIYFKVNEEKVLFLDIGSHAQVY
jgi:addiction module RelE/StbE family toxin